MDEAILGGLRCRLVGGTPGSGNLGVLLCHGYGAPGDDLVSLAPEVFRVDPTLEGRVRFIFPEAPLALSPMGPWESRAWWPLDERVLDATITRGAPLDGPRDLPAELPALRATMTSLLADLATREGIPTSRLVLGGFSQGAMLATEITLRLPESPAGLVVFSGTLLTADDWKTLAPSRRGLPTVISHGRQDPLLSFRTAEELRDLLAEGGLAVRFVPFDGPHTIGPEAFVAFVELLRRLAAS
jgi:phospholipase/carboxylesterase